MACTCKMPKKVLVKPVRSSKTGKSLPPVPVVLDALEIDLVQCYLCAKKHIMRAAIFFEEYHTGYSDRAKRLIESLKVSEDEVKSAFKLWQRIMGELNMAEGELLGNDANSNTMDAKHVALANKIRDERLKLSDNPLYVPDFDELAFEVHVLQFTALESLEA